MPEMRKLTGRWSRVLALGSALALAASAVHGCSPDGEDETERATTQETAAPPRIVVLISLDTLRADHLGLYGYERFTSPALDAQALRSVVFEDASSTAPWTLPAHASMLTGLYPVASRMITSDHALPEEIPTLASMLSKKGFDTAAVVSVLWLEREKYGLTRDFADYRYVYVPPERRSPSSLVTDYGIQTIRRLGDGRLFLFMHYFDLHADYASLPSYEKLFVTPYSGKADGTAWQLQLVNANEEHLNLCHENFDPRYCEFGDELHRWGFDESIQKVHFDEDDVRHVRELYDAGIRQLDTELGRFFSFLRQEDLLDEVLLIITSDHGEEFMDHGQMLHYLAQYQETLRIPLLISGPGVPAGVRISEPVSLVDIVPTVLALVGADGHLPTDGLDLSPLWQAEGSDENGRGGVREAFENRYLYGEASGGLTYRKTIEDIVPIRRSVRRGRFKLVYESKGETVQLYDLAEDPDETIDIAEREPRITEELVEVIRKRYQNFVPESIGRSVELDEEEIRELRALGYTTP